MSGIRPSWLVQMCFSNVASENSQGRTKGMGMSPTPESRRLDGTLLQANGLGPARSRDLNHLGLLGNSNMAEHVRLLPELGPVQVVRVLVPRGVQLLPESRIGLLVGGLELLLHVLVRHVEGGLKVFHSGPGI